MPPLEAGKYLFDIREACDRLREFTSGKTLAEYRSNALLRSAVERQFEIVGGSVPRFGSPGKTREQRRVAYRPGMLRGETGLGLTDSAKDHCLQRAG